MLKIRLRRVGRKNEPHYQVVVIPHTNSAQGHITDNLGWYNPSTKELKVDKEKLLDWVKKGAKPSNTVARLLIKNGIKNPKIVYVPNKPRAAKVDKDAKKKAPAPKTQEQAEEVTTDEVPPADDKTTEVSPKEEGKAAEAVADKQS